MAHWLHVRLVIVGCPIWTGLLHSARYSWPYMYSSRFWISSARTDGSTIASATVSVESDDIHKSMGLWHRSAPSRMSSDAVVKLVETPYSASWAACTSCSQLSHDCPSSGPSNAS